MAVTVDLQLLLQRLHTDQALIAQFEASPSAALQGFDLTGHERDAVVTRDLDDFVNLGVVDSIQELPLVLRGTPAPEPVGPRPGFLDRFQDIIRGVFRPQRPSGPRPIDPDTLPRPRPRPVPGPPGPDPPGPRPGPTPGPDPPGPGF